MSNDIAAHDARPKWGRILLGLALIPLAASLLLNLANMLESAAIQIRYPFELDYGEGIVWQQMRDIFAGKGYAPLGVYPAIVYHYPPIYHLTVMSISTLFGVDELATGRAISIACTFAIAALVGLLTAELIGKDATRRVRLACGLVAGLLLLSTEPMRAWSPLMRVDMLCYMLTLAGLILALRSLDQPVLAIYAGLVFTLAVFTKQTAIAAPIAAMGMLLVVKPRRAVVLLSTCLLVGLPIVGWLLWSTDGGFATHILRYNVNRFGGDQLSLLFGELELHLFLILAGCFGAWGAIRSTRLAGSPAPWRATITKEQSAALLILLYLILTTIMVPLILKSGARQNYLIEWFCALSILAGATFRPIATIVLEKWASLPALMTALFAVGMPVQIYPAVSKPAGDLAATTHRRETAVAPIVRLIERSQKPVISDDMTLLIRAGKPVKWESAITAELGHNGIYNEQAFARMVHAGHFAFFVTRGQRGSWLFDARYNPVVADAMDAAYPRKVVHSGYILHLPPLALPPIAKPH